MALLFTALLGLSAAILGYFLYDFSSQDFVRETEAVIDVEITHLRSTVEPYDQSQVINYLNKKIAASSGNYYRYEDSSGHLLAGNIETLPENIERITEGILRFSLIQDGVKQNFAAKIHTFDDASRVMVVRNIDGIINSFERWKRLSILIMIFMAIVVMVSFGISHFVVSRINRIAETASDIIATGDLSRRISIDTQWDDLSNLAQVLNDFLDRNEVLIEGIRDISNNIAHDLRTPLTHLRNDIEKLKKQQSDTEPFNKLLGEADHILAIFNSLLRIATLEKGKRNQAFQPLDLSQLLRDVIELYEPVAEEKHLRLQCAHLPSCTLMGDRHLLFQLFANVLDNAIKFSPAQTKIDIALVQSKDTIAVQISDQGPGIPAHEKDRVFRRFFRGDASRSTIGNGLGLSLVKAITDLHQGEIQLGDNAPGLCFVVRLKP